MFRLAVILFFQVFYFNIYAQIDLNSSVKAFKSNCVKVISPEDTIAEFNLIELSTKGQKTKLNFEIIANCAQRQKGLLFSSKDTLTILETDLVKTQTIHNLDSAEYTLEVMEETRIAEVALCDCLVNCYYEFSIPIKKIKYLTFHERTFRIRKPNKRNQDIKKSI